MTSTPNGAGTVALGIHPPSTSTASGQLDDVVAQARLAETAGFDGATFSEHHAGFEGYLPQPLLVSGWVLGETTRIWSGPVPTLLTMRNPRLLAEEIAWTAARYPGRLGVAVAGGYTPSDFEALGLSNEDLPQRFVEGLEDLHQTLAGEGPLAEDPAVRELRHRTVPMVCAVNSKTAAGRAASFGRGILMIGSDDTSRAEKIVAAYEAAGGAGPRVWIRRVHVGEVPQAARDALASVYQGEGGYTGRGPLNDFAAGSAEAIVEALLAEAAALGPDIAFNLRVHLPGLSPRAVREQIEMIGAEVLPQLRVGLSAQSARTPTAVPKEQ